MWKELVEALAATGNLTQADRQTMALYCMAYQHWREALEAIEETGPVLVDDDSGRAYKSPYRMIVNEAVAQMQSLGAELGLSPAARARLKVMPTAPNVDNDKARFFKAREESA